MALDRKPEWVVADALFDAWIAADRAKRSAPQVYRDAAMEDAETALLALAENGFVVIADEPKHFVTFNEKGWFIEHSIACRLAGTLGTCEFNQAIVEIAEDMTTPDEYGRWWIIEVDEEGLPLLEAAPL